MATPLLAQPDNDEFANRFPLSEDDVAAEGTVLDASREPGEETANGAGFGEVSVWWSWRAPRDGHIRVSASGIGGSTVRRLSVFEGEALSALTPVGSADSPTAKVEVVVQVQAGRSYAVAAIDGYGSAKFFSLRLLLLPPGDIVPIPLEGDAFAIEGTTLNAAPEPGLSGDPGQAPTVSWEWTAPGDGAVWIGMNSDEYVPRVHVFEWTPPGQLVEVFTDSGVTRGRRFLAKAGSRYRLMFSSDPGFERPFQWQLTFSRMRLTGVSPDQVLPGAAPVTVRLEDLPIGPALRELGLVESYSETRTNAPGLLDFTWQPTIPGWHVVSAYAEDTLGRLWLTPQIHLFFTPINDDFANTTTLSSAQFSQLVYLAGATAEPGEPEPDRPSVWYRWTAANNGGARIWLTWSGTVTNLSLQVFRGESLATLVPVASAEATNRSTPALFFPVSAGDTYLFAVKSGANGPASALLHLLNGPIPTNDNFVDRQMLAGTETDLETSLLLATPEPGEKGVFDNIAYRSLWYGWTPPTDGELHLRAIGLGGTQAGVGVFTGTAVNALRGLPVIRPTVAAGWNVGELWGLVRATTNYSLALDSNPFTPATNSGEARLTLDFTPAPANDAFDQRLALVGDTVDIQGTLVAARGEDIGPFNVRTTPPLQSAPSGWRAVWYEWTAPQGGMASVTVMWPDEVSAVVFTGASLGRLVQISGRFPGPPATFNAQAGGHYVIAFIQREADGGLDFLARLVALGTPPNDNFADRTALAGPRTDFTALTYGASREADEPATTTNSVWWTWTAPADGWVTLRGPREIVFSVFTGAALSSLQNVPTEIHPIFSPLLTQVQWTGFECSAGVTYQIAASRGFKTDPRSYAVELDLTSLRFTEPANGSEIRNGVPTLLEMAAPDPTVDGVLPGQLSLAYDPSGLVATIARSAGEPPQFVISNNILGTRVYWAIATNLAGERRASRPLTLRVLPDFPDNDNFANAVPVESLHYGDFIDFTGATLEPGESSHGATGAVVSRWWRWTAPATGDAQVTIRNPDGVGLYTGGSLDSLVPVLAERIDGGAEISWRFATQRGQTYFLALAGTPFSSAIFHGWEWSPVTFPGLAREQILFADQRDIGIAVDLPPDQVNRVELHASDGKLGVAYGPPYVVRIDSLPLNQTAEYVRALVVKTDGSSLWSLLPHRILWRLRNDDFAGRTPLVGELVVADFNGANTSREPGEPDHGRPDLLRTVWWTWTAPADGVLEIPGMSTTTRFAIYQGDTLKTLSLVAAADNGLIVPVKAGAIYQIAVASNFPGGQLRLDFAQPVAGPLVLTGTNAAVTVPLTGSTPEFVWTAPASGLLVVAFEDPQYTPSARLLREGASVELFGYVERRAFAWTVQAGATYVIQLDWGSELLSQRKWHLSLHQGPANTNDFFANALVLTEPIYDLPVVYNFATMEPGEPVYVADGIPPFIGSLWFAWTAPESGRVKVSTRSATARPFVFQGSTLGSLSPASLSIGGKAFFEAAAGATYRIAVAAFWFNMPPLSPPADDFLTIQYEAPLSPPFNDAFANATLLAGAPATFAADTHGATREFAEPLHAGIYGGRSLWWRWTAPRTGRARLITMPRTGVGCQLAVYRGDSLAALTLVAALSFPDYGGELAFNAQAGIEYRIALDGTHGDEPRADVELRSEGELAAPQFTSFERRLDGALHLSVRASPGAAFVLEGSNDLQNWSEEQRGTIDFIGEQTIQLPITAAVRKFFRVRTD